MKIVFSAQSDVGNVRNKNEDNLYCDGKYITEDNRNVPFLFDGTSEENLQIYAVCDGMGGEEHGEVASLTAVRVILKYETKLRDMSYHSLSKYMQMCFSEISRQIEETCQDKSFSRVGTTAALLVVDDDNLHAFNIGDSRIYLLRGKKMKQLTVDHTPAQRDYQLGLIKKEEIKTHPFRHKLTQYLGLGADEFEASASELRVKAKNKDRVLICSDGITDMLTDQEIRAVLCGAKTPQEATNTLVEAAKRSGGRDNISAILLDVYCDRKFLWF